MDSEDDIFLIHNKVNAYLTSLDKAKQQLIEDRTRLATRLFQSPPPYGFSIQTYKELAKTYDLPYSPPSNKQAPKITYKEAKDIIQQIESIQHVTSFENVRETFQQSSVNILASYKRLLENPIHNDFMNARKGERDHNLMALYHEYIDLIASLFGDDVLNAVAQRRHSKQSAERRDSSSDWSADEIEELTGQVNTVEGDDWSGMVYADLHRISFNQKFSYIRRSHFKDTIIQFQAKQSRNIPQNVIDDVIDMIKKHGLFDDTKSTPLEQYAKVTKEHIRMFLEESNHPKSYEDLQLIYTKITSKPPPNIEQYEDALYQDFDLLVDAFLSLEHVDRKNFLNSHFVLRCLLQRRGVQVSDSDLNTLKTPTRLRTHEDIFMQCCQKLGWNYKPSL